MSLWVFKGFLNENGRNEIDEWYKGLPVKAKARFRTILEHFRDIPQNLWPPKQAKHLVDGQGVFEIRFTVNNVVYRPLGCFGPEKNEFTFLIGAREQGDEFVPRNALTTAIHRKNIVLNEKGKSGELQF